MVDTAQMSLGKMNGPMSDGFPGKTALGPRLKVSAEAVMNQERDFLGI